MADMEFVKKYEKTLRVNAVVGYLVSGFLIAFAFYIAPMDLLYALMYGITGCVLFCIAQVFISIANECWTYIIFDTIVREGLRMEEVEKGVRCIACRKKIPKNHYICLRIGFTDMYLCKNCADEYVNNIFSKWEKVNLSEESIDIKPDDFVEDDGNGAGGV